METVCAPTHCRRDTQGVSRGQRPGRGSTPATDPRLSGGNPGALSAGPGASPALLVPGGAAPDPDHLRSPVYPDHGFSPPGGGPAARLADDLGTRRTRVRPRRPGHTAAAAGHGRTGEYRAPGPPPRGPADGGAALAGALCGGVWEQGPNDPGGADHGLYTLGRAAAVR